MTHMPMTLRRLGLSAAMTGAAGVAFAATLLAAGTIAPATADAAERPLQTGRVDAASFARQVVGLIARNRYEQAWRSLHPSHQAAAGFAEYVSCEQRSPIPGRLVSVTAGRPVSEVTVLTPGRTVLSRAVRIRIVLLDVATQETTVVPVKMHAVPIGGGWRWILPQARLADYADDRCGAAPPPVPGYDR